MLLNLQEYMESHYGKSVINISSILLHLLIPRRYHLLFNKKKKCCHASLYLNGTVLLIIPIKKYIQHNLCMNKQIKQSCNYK